MESLTFPGSSFDLGTFRKHLFRDKLCRIEFWNKNKSVCELTITIFFKDLHVPHIYKFFLSIIEQQTGWFWPFPNYINLIEKKSSVSKMIKKKDLHLYWQYINKINNTLPYWTTQRLNLIIAAMLLQCHIYRSLRLHDFYLLWQYIAA